LLVRVDRGHELRERASEIARATGHVGFDRVTLSYSDLDRLVHQVLEHADDVVVVEPVALREAVVDALSSLSRGA
jgi:predicted DNA-binding transcriptional regulator YafY